MLDERWSDEVKEVATALQRILAVESSPERVRAAEISADGRDRVLEQQLNNFGLNALEGTPELFACVAYELGRFLAPVALVETFPVLAILGRPRVAMAFDGLAPALVEFVAVRHDTAVVIQALHGTPQRSSAGDLLVQHVVDQGDGERVGDMVLASRLSRYAALVDAARMVGAGQALLAYGVNYAKERQQFGKIIGTYQGVAHRLAQAAGHLDAAELLVRKAAFTALPEAGGDGAPSDAFALMVRAKAIDAARFVATNVHQVFGGNGFAMEYDVQLYSRRLRSWAMRGQRPGRALADLGRLVLDPARRDALRLMWHFDEGMPLPQWAAEADARVEQE